VVKSVSPRGENHHDEIGQVSSLTKQAHRGVYADLRHFDLGENLRYGKTPIANHFLELWRRSLDTGLHCRDRSTHKRIRTDTTVAVAIPRFVWHPIRGAMWLAAERVLPYV
jgi:hypothetical protein